MSDANHIVHGKRCSRYYCNASAAVDTEMGAMCAEHASPLLFEVQMPRVGNMRKSLFLPWEFVRGHDRQAQRNHGGQTLGRLSERGGLSADEVCAVLENREWRRLDQAVAEARIAELLAAWRAAR